jgi:uncharacterized spore protein YtfJ
MSDELTTIPNLVEANDTAAQTLELMDKTMQTFLGAASVNAVYGQPVAMGDTILIPAAEVLSGMGFGMGGGSGSGPVSGSDDDDEAEADVENAPTDEGVSVNVAGGSGIGGGGGGRVLSRPVAVIIASPNGVRVEPVVDATKIALAMFTAIGFMVGMMARMRRNSQED